VSRRPHGDLVAWWNDKEKDISFAWDRQKADGHLLHCVLSAARLQPATTGPGEPVSLCGMHAHGKSFLEELLARGFDLSTLRFSVSRKKEAPDAGGA